MPSTVIFDFDGTIAIGDGPVDAYARCVAEESGGTGLADAISAAREELRRTPGAYRDGYDAVATAARAMGVTERALSAAYLASRALLATPEAPISAPPGLPEFLDRLAQDATAVLVTNSPDVRIREALGALGVAHAFARYVCSAGKPDGLGAEIAAALTDGPVLSVGDIDEYDLAPARALGAATALVGPAAGTHGDLNTFAAERLELLYDDIQTWAAGTAPLTSAPAGA